MPDLRDGQSIEMQGSASKPYILKNVGGVYSCSCPAWRNQSLGIERRTCKHLRKLRGDAAEQARIGASLPTQKIEPNDARQVPQLLLAESWDGQLDPTGWWMSEKLDGVRASWDGEHFWSRQGNIFHAPSWFTAGLPDSALDGELWLGRKQFQRTVSIVRRHDQPSTWKDIVFAVFDAPTLNKPFEDRLGFLGDCLSFQRTPYARIVEQWYCHGRDHLQSQLDLLTGLGAEGLMLRQPGSRYEAGRSSTLLKVKRFQDAEARVIGHQGGTRRHKGRLGALLAEMANGVRFAVGTGFTDAQRDQPVPIGSTITFRYQELSDRGVPRFPSFVGIRVDAEQPTQLFQGENLMSSVASQTRRFEFSEGNSNKFWEVSHDGSDVKIRFGRIGTQGQSQIKAFGDEETANKHIDKLVKEKTGKGYREVA